MKIMLHRRQYVLKTCHIVWNILIYIFKDCGEVVDIQFKTDCEGRFRGFGFVKFETVEAAQKALKLHNTELLNRHIKINIAQEKSEYPPYRSSFHTDGNLYSHTVKGFDASLVENKPKSPVTPNETKGTLKTVYVGNLSYTVERADMEKLFKGYGEIVDIRLHTDREGKFKGNGHVQFATEESAQKLEHPIPQVRKFSASSNCICDWI
ncbi:nucleolin 1 [Lathyrus oleraceus]|uniref:nucleolin 1 n=1 Tax=Pisum sativum TaxID=3888 RepID=UPI0021D0B8E5|nr:nucleolin 1-like [Pisum sativum]